MEIIGLTQTMSKNTPHRYIHYKDDSGVIKTIIFWEDNWSRAAIAAAVAAVSGKAVNQVSWAANLVLPPAMAPQTDKK